MLGPEAMQRLLRDVNDRYELTEGQTWTQMCAHQLVWVPADEEEQKEEVLTLEERFKEAQDRNYRWFEMRVLQDAVADIVDENKLFKEVHDALKPFVGVDLIPKMWQSLQELFRDEEEAVRREEIEDWLRYNRAKYPEMSPEEIMEQCRLDIDDLDGGDAPTLDLFARWKSKMLASE